MFTVNEDLSIYATRGDIVFFSVTADDNGESYTFKAGDVVRFTVYGKKDANTIYLQKDFQVYENTGSVEVFLNEEDTRIGDVISKHSDYWYEVELNPGNNPQTIIGYDDEGAKIFRLFPEGADIPEYVPDEEDIPFVDEHLDMTSPRPLQNMTIAKELAKIEGTCERAYAAVAKRFVTPEMMGAAGDGIADDTEALQLALNSGRSVMLMPGTYRITDTLTVPVGCSVIGDGNCVISPECETAFFLKEKTSLSGFSVSVRSESVKTVFEVNDNSTEKESMLEILIENMSVSRSVANDNGVYTVCHFHTDERGIYNINVRGCTFDNYPASGYVARVYSTGDSWISTVVFDGNYSRAFKWHYFFDCDEETLINTHGGQHIVSNCVAQCNPVTNGFIFISGKDVVYAKSNVTWDWGSSKSGSVNCPGRPYVIAASLLNEDTSFTNVRNYCDYGYSGGISVYDGTAFSSLPIGRQDIFANIGGQYNPSLIPKFVGLSRDNAICLYDGTTHTINDKTRIRFWWVDASGITYVSVVPTKGKVFVSQPIASSIYFGVSTDKKRVYVYREEGVNLPAYTGIITLPTDASLTMAINDGGSGMVERTPNCYDFMGRCYYSALPETVEKLKMELAQPAYVNDDSGAIYRLNVIENDDGYKELSITRAWESQSELK